ncbi:glycosyltransferase family 39 protein [Flavobacteriaceae bacterium SZ-1-7]|uniref:glycosyltransferase family 39 protein n=1 Tax=Tamlana sedimenti TaxID=3134126 RepID=UPI003124CE08
MGFNYRTTYYTLIVLAIVHLIFLFVKISLGDFFLQDSHEYYQLAENIKNHFTFYSADLNAQINFEEYTKRPPFYGIFVLVFSFFLKSKTAVIIVQNILSFLGIVLTLKIFKHYFKQVNVKLFVTLIIISLSQFIYANYLMSEILLQFLIILLCYTFHKTIQTKKLKYVLYSQIIIVLLFLTKPVFYLFIIPNVLICLWLTKKIVKKAYLFSLIPIAAFFMYISWNAQRTGSYEFSSIQNLSLKNYNLKYFHIKKYGEDFAQKVNNEISSKANNTTNYKERQKTIKTTCVDYIKKDLFSYAWHHVRGSAMMFLDPGRFDLYNFFNYKNKEEEGFLAHLNKSGIAGAFQYFKEQPFLILILLPFILLFNIIKAVGFILFWLKQENRKLPISLFTLCIIIYIAALTGPSGASRFLVPILPIYCMFAAQGFNKRLNVLK